MAATDSLILNMILFNLRICGNKKINSTIKEIFAYQIIPYSCIVIHNDITMWCTGHTTVRSARANGSVKPNLRTYAIPTNTSGNSPGRYR
jgi:hypothetical protein